MVKATCEARIELLTERCLGTLFLPNQPCSSWEDTNLFTPMATPNEFKRPAAVLPEFIVLPVASGLVLAGTC